MDAPKVRLAIRGFADGCKRFEDQVQIEETELDAVLPALAQKHGAALGYGSAFMIEIEFLDEPDLEQRFFRFGTDPAGMVQPIAIQLDGGTINDV